MKRRGPKYTPADVEVPEKFSEWSFEYRIGYNDGLKKKSYALSPRIGNFQHCQRKAAYIAGRDAGRKLRLERQHEVAV